MFRAAAFAACMSSLFPLSAAAEVLIDVDANTVKAAVGETTLDDLSINDSAVIYSSFCIKDRRLYVPGWTSPSSLGTNTYAATGVLFKALVLPGKKLRITLIDAAQAQNVAKGNPSAPPVLSTDDFNKEVRGHINHVFSGGSWGTLTCDDEQRQNPLKTLTLFEVESINGFNSLSELLKSVAK